MKFSSIVDCRFSDDGLEYVAIEGMGKAQSFNATMSVSNCSSDSIQARHIVNMEDDGCP